MCKLSKNGYEMDDGTLIPFTNISLADIAPKHINELNKNASTMWDSLLMRSSIIELKDVVQNLSVTKKVKEERIREIANEEIRAFPKRKLFSMAKTAKGITILLGLLIAIVSVISIFTNIFD